MDGNQWLSLLQETPWLLPGIAVLLGLIVGSFLNVVILRLPRMMRLRRVGRGR